VSRCYILSVSELIPYFGKSPVSYASYPLLRDAYISFDIEISIKPESPDGKAFLSTCGMLYFLHIGTTLIILHALSAVVAAHLLR